MVQVNNASESIAARIVNFNAHIVTHNMVLEALQSFGLDTLTTPEGWSFSMEASRRFNWQTDTYDGVVTVTFIHRLELDWDYKESKYVNKRSWRAIAREIASIRKMYGITKMTRSVDEGAYVTNKYTGTRKLTNDVTIMVEISTGNALPGTCELVEDGYETVPAYKQPKYKVVCK